MRDFVLQSRRVATREGLRPAAVRIRGGRIVAVEDPGSGGHGLVEDAGGSVVFPGLVDTHVHVNEPGRAHWEGFETATRAAAAGGVTTLIDMPLNSVPPTISLDALRSKLAAAARISSVHVGFWGGAVPGNDGELGPLAAAGVFGFKCFLAPSGVPEFAEIDDAALGRAMERIAALRSVLLVHAEDPSRLRPLADGISRAYSDYLASRPAEAETAAVEAVLRHARRTGARVHVLHLSSADALAALDRARRDGVAVTVETCPHYLVFSAEEIPDGATVFKCAPPIRERENRERLWRGLVGGAIDQIVSDHSPSPPEGKRVDRGDFAAAWGGIASLELTLSATWTAARRRGVSLEQIAEWMSAAPARLAGLDDQKGAIAPGYDADLLVWDPEAPRVVDAKSLAQRHKLTPYANRELFGVVRATYLKGEKIWEDGRLLHHGRGELLLSS